MTLQQHIEELDRLLEGSTDKPRMRSQLAFIGREIAALEADYASLHQTHTTLHQAHTGLQEAHSKLQKSHTDLDAQLWNQRARESHRADDVTWGIDPPA